MRENRKENWGGGVEVCLVGSEKEERKWWGPAVFSLGPRINLLKLGRKHRRKWGARGLDEIAQHIQIFINVDLSFSSLLFHLFRSYHSFFIIFLMCSSFAVFAFFDIIIFSFFFFFGVHFFSKQFFFYFFFF